MDEKFDALVLRTADYGEYDRMLTLFTLQKGKISAAAKGVRRAGAKLRFAAQPFCFAEYVLAVRGERRTVISASNTDGFYALREDVNKFYAAAALCGLCDVLLFENIVNEELFLRAVAALKEMCEGDELLALLRFFLRALSLSGYALAPLVCADCGQELAGRAYFELSEGCFTCAECARGAGVSAGTLAVLRACGEEEVAACREEELAADGKRRALKLLYAYFRTKTDARVAAIEELLRLP